MQQLNLFQESTPVLPITYYPDFLNLEQANLLYQHCLKLEWQQNQIRIAGKTMPVPGWPHHVNKRSLLSIELKIMSLTLAYCEKFRRSLWGLKNNQARNPDFFVGS